jgi:protein-disulfide isomerase
MFVKTFAAILIAAGIGMASLPAVAQEDAPLTPKQVDGVQKIIRAYLLEHPEVISDAVEALREKMRAQSEADSKKAILSYKDELFDSKDDPIAGNPKGDVTLVEFFDYNCGFCKQTMDAMFDAAKADGKVKIVLKDFPILTDDSTIAARVALAAKKQGKYDDIHRAFMKYRGRLDEKAIWHVAADTGLNIDQIKRDMGSPDIDKQLRRTRELAHDLDIGGTPAFIIGDRIMSGALDQQVLKQLFEVNRKNGKTAAQ